MSDNSTRAGPGGERVQKKPQQPTPLACEPCRSSRIKCDRSLPICEQCRKRSKETTCKYRRRANANTDGGSLREKLERLERFMSKIQQPEGTQTIDENQMTPGSASDEDTCRMMGSLKLSKDGRAQLKAPSHWESIVDDIADIRAFIESKGDVDDSDHNQGPVDPVDIHLGLPLTLSLDSILALLPPRLSMDRWITAWFNLRHQSRIIVHAPTFQSQYASFWYYPQHTDPAWLALLLSIGSSGAILLGQGSNERATLEAGETLRRLAAHSLVLAGVTVVRPYLIEALIVYVNALVFKHHDTLPETWQLMGLITRLCFQAGLNREVSNMKDSRLSAFDIEMRRRVWIIARDYDISTSSILGNVCYVDPKLCDTAPPSNLLDVDFSPTKLGQPRPWDEYTAVQFQICYSRVMELLGEATSLSHHVIPPTRGEIQSLGDRLDKARDELPEPLRLKSLEDSFIDSPADIMDRFRLEFAHQRTTCVLYRRLLGDPSDELSLKCMRAAEVIVEHSSALLDATEPGGQMVSSKTFILRHLHDFLLAAMLLCSEVTRESRMLSEQTSTKSTLSTTSQKWLQLPFVSPKLQIALKAIIQYCQGTGALQSGGILSEDVLPSELFMFDAASGAIV